MNLQQAVAVFSLLPLRQRCDSVAGHTPAATLTFFHCVCFKTVYTNSLTTIIGSEAMIVYWFVQELTGPVPEGRFFRYNRRTVPVLRVMIAGSDLIALLYNRCVIAQIRVILTTIPTPQHLTLLRSFYKSHLMIRLLPCIARRNPR